jgi:hypothetical protein
MDLSLTVDAQLPPLHEVCHSVRSTPSLGRRKSDLATGLEGDEVDGDVVLLLTGI